MNIALVGAGSPIHHLLCQSEVENLDSFIGQDEDVFRLEVTMHNTFLVSCRESLCNLQNARNIFRHPAPPRHSADTSSLAAVGTVCLPVANRLVGTGDQRDLARKVG